MNRPCSLETFSQEMEINEKFTEKNSNFITNTATSSSHGVENYKKQKLKRPAKGNREMKTYGFLQFRYFN